MYAISQILFLMFSTNCARRCKACSDVLELADSDIQGCRIPELALERLQKSQSMTADVILKRETLRSIELFKNFRRRWTEARDSVRVILMHLSSGICTPHSYSRTPSLTELVADSLELANASQLAEKS